MEAATETIGIILYRNYGAIEQNTTALEPRICNKNHQISDLSRLDAAAAATATKNGKFQFNYIIISRCMPHCSLEVRIVVVRFSVVGSFCEEIILVGHL